MRLWKVALGNTVWPDTTCNDFSIWFLKWQLSSLSQVQMAWFKKKKKSQKLYGQNKWNSNVHLFLSSQVHHGIKGMVYDENSNPVGNAEISVAGVNHDVTTGEEGGWSYWGAVVSSFLRTCGCYLLGDFFFFVLNCSTEEMWVSVWGLWWTIC